jgi:plasmid stabilization system protein ParE
MNFKLAFSPGAKQDFDEASDWYQWRDPKLKTDFISSVNESLLLVQSMPESFPVVFGTSVRRALVNKFPFAILFSVLPGEVYIYSVFHTSRNPIIWQGRID